LILLGCSPKEEEVAPVERQPPPTPSEIPFTILSDAENLHFHFLKSYFDRINPQPAKYFVRWVNPSENPESWDFALVRPWNLEDVESHSIDLRSMLEEAYPKHPSDFFVSVDSGTEEAELHSLPIVHIPDFLFARNRPQWNFQFDPEAFKAEVKAGAKIGMPDRPGMFQIQSQLGVAEKQIVRIDWTDPQNPFAKGEIDLAIGPKGWLLEKQVPGLSVISLADLGLGRQVPDAGYRIAISNNCVDSGIAQSLFANLITEGQASLVGIADAFPIRRSVYSSPRVQGPLFAFYKKAFDLTLANLDPNPLSK
jgi:hypothetical protein